jgi:predicted dehydrogenase
MQRVRLGVIGLGMIGKVHAETAAKLAECQMVAVSDVNPNTEKIAKAIGTSYFRDYQEMIEKEDLEGVVIAVPNNLHADVGITCAQKRLHILLEKPIASTLSDADRLIESARQNKVRILVGHHRRFSAAINAVREMIQSGQIGKLVGVAIVWSMYKPDEYFDLAWRKMKGGGPILINAIHEIDNLRYLCGRINRVYAEASNAARKFEVEDSLSVSVKLDSGALASIFMSDAAPSLWAYEATTGENPFFFHSTENCYYIFGTEASLTFPHLRKIYYHSHTHRGWQHPITAEEINVPRVDPYEEQLKHFCRVVQGVETPRTSGEDARKTLEITLAVHKSTQTGQPVVV